MHVGGGTLCVGGGRGWCGGEGKGTHRRRRQAFEVSCGHRARGHTIEQEGSRQPPVSKKRFERYSSHSLERPPPFSSSTNNEKEGQSDRSFYFIYRSSVYCFLFSLFLVFSASNYTHDTHTKSFFLLPCTLLPKVPLHSLVNFCLLRTHQAFLGRDFGDGVNATRPLAQVLLLVLAEEGA
jgi:hypothetical protein